MVMHEHHRSIWPMWAQSVKLLALYIPIAYCAILIQGGCSKENGPLFGATQPTSPIVADLPLGTPKDNVESYLKRNGFDYSLMSEQGIILAKKRDTEGNAIVKTSVQATIQLDKDNNVESIKVREIFTGP